MSSAAAGCGFDNYVKAMVKMSCNSDTIVHGMCATDLYGILKLI